MSALLPITTVFAQDAGKTNGAGTATEATGSDYRATSGTRDRDRGFDYGWLGLAGLIGLAGLARRDRNNLTHDGRTAHR